MCFQRALEVEQRLWLAAKQTEIHAAAFIWRGTGRRCGYCEPDRCGPIGGDRLASTVGGPEAKKHIDLTPPTRSTHITIKMCSATEKGLLVSGSLRVYSVAVIWKCAKPPGLCIFYYQIWFQFFCFLSVSIVCLLISLKMFGFSVSFKRLYNVDTNERLSRLKFRLSQHKHFVAKLTDTEPKNVWFQKCAASFH